MVETEFLPVQTEPVYLADDIDGLLRQAIEKDFEAHRSIHDGVTAQSTCHERPPVKVQSWLLPDLRVLLVGDCGACEERMVYLPDYSVWTTISQWHAMQTHASGPIVTSLEDRYWDQPERIDTIRTSAEQEFGRPWDELIALC